MGNIDDVELEAPPEKRYFRRGWCGLFDQMVKDLRVGECLTMDLSPSQKTMVRLVFESRKWGCSLLRDGAEYKITRLS